MVKKNEMHNAERASYYSYLTANKHPFHKFIFMFRVMYLCLLGLFMSPWMNEHLLECMLWPVLLQRTWMTLNLLFISFWVVNNIWANPGGRSV